MQPKAFLFENVRGLLRPAFSEYLNYLKLSQSTGILESLESRDCQAIQGKLAETEFLAMPVRRRAAAPPQGA